MMRTTAGLANRPSRPMLRYPKRRAQENHDLVGSLVQSVRRLRMGRMLRAMTVRKDAETDSRRPSP